jgi:hypothetical protein
MIHLMAEWRAGSFHLVLSASSYPPQTSQPDSSEGQGERQLRISGLCPVLNKANQIKAEEMYNC